MAVLRKTAVTRRPPINVSHPSLSTNTAKPGPNPIELIRDLLFNPRHTLTVGYFLLLAELFVCSFVIYKVKCVLVCVCVYKPLLISPGVFVLQSI